MAEDNVDGQVTHGKIETDDGVSKEKYPIMVETTTDNPVDMDLDVGDLENSTILAETTTGGLMNQENVEHEIKSVTDASIEAEDTVVPTVITQHSEAHLTRSTVSSAPILKGKVQSRYLRASTGSCHDFCKYGHKNHAEDNSSVPLWKTIREGRERAKAQLAGESEKKKLVVRRLSFPGTKVEKDNALALQKAEDVIGPKLESMSSRKISSSTRPSGQLTRSGSNVIKTSKKVGTQPMDSLAISNPAVKEIKVNNDLASHTNGKERPMGTARTPASPRPVMRKAASMNVRRYGNLKGSSDTKNQTALQERNVTQTDDVPEKTLYVIEPTGDQKTISPQSTGKTRKVRPAERGSHVKKSRGYSSSQKGINTVGHSFSSSVSSFPSKSMLSTVPESSQSGQEEQGRPGSTRSRQSDASSKEKGRPGSTRSRQSDASSESGKLRSIINPRAKSIVGQKTSKAKRVGPSQPSGDKDGSSWKLKFRRGAVITLPTTSSSPRKLKFRRERILVGNPQNINGVAASGRRRMNDNHVADNESATKAQLEKVILRHQEAGEKKDDVNLNYVIEETAGKLVQTRKSKVKALVGAFESVMSLRERKRVAATSAS